MPQESDAFFEVDSRLLLQLGEKLVKDRSVALAELVKNSYDADASKVKISMHSIKEPGGTIIVEDNGTGMSLSIFQKTWMRIATVDKENNPISKKYIRQKAGEKGIGRFACRSLSKKLILKSIVHMENGDREELIATFDWESFKAGLDIDKIPIIVSSKIVNSDIPTGTTLTLENTNGSWNNRDIRHLRNELRDLINPSIFMLKEESGELDPGLDISFDIPEFPNHEEPLDSAFFKNSWAKLVGTINPDGFAEYFLQLKNGEIRTLKRESNYKYIKNAKLEVYIFSYDAESFDSSDISKNRAAKIGRERGGVKVYADRFRIFGYGIKGDDWLRLDYDRSRSIEKLDDEVDVFVEKGDRPGLRIFRNANLFGYVAFSKDINDLLEITINRERLIENDAFDELKHFARLGIDFSTVIYSNHIYARKKEKDAKLKREKEELARAEEESIRKAEEERKNAEEAIRLAEEEKRKIEDLSERLEEERREAEVKRRTAEEDRREAEDIRRDLERKRLLGKLTDSPEIKEKLIKAKVIEKEKINREIQAKKSEEELIIKENEARERVRGERKKAELIRQEKEEERKLIGKKIKLRAATPP